MLGSQWLRRQVEAAPHERQAARLWLLEVLGLDASRFYADPDRELSDDQEARLLAGWQRYQAGEPLAYICGYEIFRGLRLQVDARVLAPRPETEELVEQALQLPLPETAEVVDLGTGSAAIACALAHERRHWQVSAVERSEDALAVAAHNIAEHGGRVRLFAGSWYEPLPGRHFDLIVANPPYIAAHEPEMADLHHEPRSALVAADAGLADLHHIIDHAPGYLRRGGWLLLEHGWRQGDGLRQRLRGAGWTAVASRCDLAGHERMTWGCWHG